MATILHVDMDAFFASVEVLHHPEWRGKPLVVGAGPHERGVVSTCSYEARRYGVHSAMPSRTAYARCPHAIFVEPHMELYEEVSRRAFACFERFTPYVEGVSIDEAFLDVTGCLHLHPGDTPTARARNLATALKREIRATCGITCSVGIAANRLLAKIGSELKKPDGLSLLPFEPDAVAAFLRPRPVGILWGIGRKTESALRPYAIATCGDLQRLGIDQLAAILGSHEVAAQLHDAAFGRSDDTVHWQPEPEKSVSREYTFPTDEANRAVIRAKLLELVEEVGARFRTRPRWARTARLKLRDADFRTYTRQIAFDAPARDDISFRAKALELFDRECLPCIRLVGFGVTNIQDDPDEPSLFVTSDTAHRLKRERLSETLDALRRIYPSGLGRHAP